MSAERPAVMPVPMDALSPLLQECLTAGQEITLTITGNSMAPFLRHRRDCVVLRQPMDATTLQVGDVSLYRRQDGRLVLHRIVERDDGKKRRRYGEREALPSMHSSGSLTYTMCGDAQTVYEPNVQPQQILAVAVAFWRKNNYEDCCSTAYRRRSLRWHRLMPVRRVLVWLYHLPMRVWRKLKRSKEI